MADTHEQAGKQLIPAPEGAIPEATAACEFAFYAAVRRWNEVLDAQAWSQVTHSRVDDLGAMVCNHGDVLTVQSDVWVPYTSGGERMAQDYQRAVRDKADSSEWEREAYGEYQAWASRVSGIVDDLLVRSLITVEARPGHPGFPLYNARPDAEHDPRKIIHASYRGYDATRGVLMLLDIDGNMRAVGIYRRYRDRKTGASYVAQAADIRSIGFMARE